MRLPAGGHPKSSSLEAPIIGGVSGNLGSLHSLHTIETIVQPLAISEHVCNRVMRGREPRKAIVLCKQLGCRGTIPYHTHHESQPVVEVANSGVERGWDTSLAFCVTTTACAHELLYHRKHSGWCVASLEARTTSRPQFV